MSAAFQETAFGFLRDEEYSSIAADIESWLYYAEVAAAANKPQHNITVVHQPFQELVSMRTFCRTHNKYLPDKCICNKCEAEQMAALVHPK